MHHNSHLFHYQIVYGHHTSVNLSGNHTPLCPPVVFSVSDPPPLVNHPCGVQRKGPPLSSTFVVLSVRAPLVLHPCGVERKARHSSAFYWPMGSSTLGIESPKDTFCPSADLTAPYSTTGVRQCVCAILSATVVVQGCPPPLFAACPPLVSVTVQIAVKD